MDDFQKEQRNLTQLTTASKTIFIYIPIQYGHMSKHPYRAKVVDEIVLKDDGREIRYKRLKVYKRDGTYKELLWCHRRLHRDYKGTYCEFVLDKFNEEEWHGLEHIEKEQMIKLIKGKG